MAYLPRRTILATAYLFLAVPTLLSIHNAMTFSAANSTASVMPSCDSPPPLNYVWMSFRLYAISKCTAVSGIVDAIGHSDDGDVDFLLDVDPPYKKLINVVNVSKQKGDLIVEIVCDGPVTNIFAMGGCGGYKNSLPLPKVGDHIYVTGAQVLDLLHGGWIEVHPVYSIKTLR
jgi:hypothetical protein